MKAWIWAGASGVAMAGLIAACAPEAEITTGRSDYQKFCVDCHGPEGKGDGPLADSLTQKPVDITKVAARHGGVFPKTSVMSHIYGYTAGRSESPMPEFGDILEGRTVMYDTGDGIETPTPWRLVALTEYVEGMQE